MLTRSKSKSEPSERPAVGEKPRYKAKGNSGSSSASSAVTVARLKAAEAEKKQRLLEIAKREAAAERDATEATFEATIAALEAEEVQSRHSSRIADWVAESNFDAETAHENMDAPDRSLLCEQSAVIHTVHPTVEVHETTHRLPAATATVVAASLPRPPNKAVLRLPGYGKKDSPPVSEVEKLTNAIVSLARPSNRVELTQFSGNPSEWLLFKRTYEDSKALYSPGENIARLRRALSGEAKDAVLSLLLCSSDPEPVMRSLESRFARPKCIVLNEIVSLRALPRVAREPNALAAYASKVKNCVSVVSLLNQSYYIHSPEFINVLVTKLDALLQNKWCDFAAVHCIPGQPQIEVFADFLDAEADKLANFGACEAFSSAPSRPPAGNATTAPPQRYNPRPPRTAQAHHVDISSAAVPSPCPDSASSSGTSTSLPCLYCGSKEHNVKSCSCFSSLKIPDRISWVRTNKVCIRCLRKGKHNYRTCKVKPCGIDGCKELHNKILHCSQNTFHPSVNNVVSSVIPQSLTSYDHHDTVNQKVTLLSDDHGTSTNNYFHGFEKKSQSNEFSFPYKNETVTSVKETITNTTYSCTPKKENSVLLKVIPVILSGPKGALETFALLDDGSTVTPLDEELAERLGVTGTRETMRVETITGTTEGVSAKLINFTIQGKYGDKKYNINNARAISNLKLRPQEVSVGDTDFEHLRDISDRLVFKMGVPKVLIGTSDWPLLLSEEARVGTAHQPVAIRTALGWVLFGHLPGKINSSHSINFVHTHTSDSCDNELDTLIRDYYKLDSIGIKLQEKINSEDARAISTLEKTTRRLSNGRFEVGLPWREEMPHIPDSYYLAFSRFQSLRKRLNLDHAYAELYRVNIEAYVQKDYAEECIDNHDNPTSPSRRWYLPHFGVTNPNKPGKLRIVHDASARTSGVSLNTLILPGPDLLQSLFGILMRFREGQVALNGDIREMFPQIKIREEDRDCQRYIWLSEDGRLKEFRMSSLIFGASASPFTAIYIKNRNARDFQDQYPEAATSIIRDHYMDDFLGSCESVESAAKLASEIVHIHAQCGFEMRSWVSNVPEALNLIPTSLRKESSGNVDLNLCGTQAKTDVRVLGMHWNPALDTFSFKINVDVPAPSKCTKRQVLRDLMRIYDPLGLLQPKVTRGKILFQRTWRLVKQWDDPLPSSERTQWEEWYRDIQSVLDFSIPRAYKALSSSINQELHVFTDASEDAYACVAFWRFLFEDGSTHLALIASKSRVAPLKPVSIPRLELQAALLGVRLAQSICSEHRGQASRRIFWCDSKTVLAWIRSDSRKYKAFVSHRLGEIAEYTNVEEWRWVPTALNVADDATRTGPTSLDRWWHGPSFLKDSEDAWPQETGSVNDSLKIDAELKPRENVSCVNHIFLSAVRFSDWRRLLRATARVFQFCRLLRGPNARVADTLHTPGLRPLLALDVKNAENFLLKQSQQESFAEEITCLQQGKNIPRLSRIHQLSPKLDREGLLRACGRITSAPGMTLSAKEPIILDGRHPIVRLLIRKLHIWAMHGHNETVVNKLRQKYCVLHLRPSVRFVAAKCQVCRERRVKPECPPTGDLPVERLQHHHRPFSFVGLDYFGPLEVAVKRSREKRYVALFTCLVTRAIHLELVWSLTSDSAIMALRRFIARRGCPIKILSDNGTAFVGANRLLNEAWSAIDHSKIQEIATCENIECSFIPPAAPFMGGVWERLVGTVKRALAVTLRERAPREEVLVTLLAEIEQVVNSRPLTHVAVAHDDEPSLTPNHFLIGAYSVLPTPDSCDADLISRATWKRANRLADHFWSRWVREYLPTLLPRGRLVGNYNNIRVGDVVTIADPNLPRGVWPRGRVVQVFPGPDGIVRVADIQTRAGTLRRPVRKLLKLELSP